MASTKCVKKLKVLADTTRLAVVNALYDAPQHVGELGKVLNIEQSLLSHHLSILRKAGLVNAVRDGKAVLYQLAPGVSGIKNRRAINLGCCELAFPKPTTEKL